MGIHVNSTTPDSRGNGHDLEVEETPEEFETRIYDALMRVARLSSARLRSALGSCVILGTKYDQAPDDVREAVRDFVDAAEL